MDFLDLRLTLAVHDINQEFRMSAIDRIKAKALQARDIAPQAIKDFESDLDGILAEKGVLAQKREAAVAPHKEAISGIYSEFDGLKQAMDMLSNGGPSLDPLPVSATVLPVSPPPLPVDTGATVPVVDTGEVERLKLRT